MERATILWMLQAAQMSNLPTLIYKFHVILFKIPAGLFEGLDKFVLKYIEAIMSTIAEFILEKRARGGGRRRPTPPTWSGGFPGRRWTCTETLCNELSMALGSERSLAFSPTPPRVVLRPAAGAAWLTDSLLRVHDWFSWVPWGRETKTSLLADCPREAASVISAPICKAQMGFLPGITSGLRLDSPFCRTHQP